MQTPPRRQRRRSPPPVRSIKAPPHITDVTADWSYLAKLIDAMEVYDVTRVLGPIDATEDEQQIHDNNVHTYLWLTRETPYEPSGLQLSVDMLMASLHHDGAEERLCQMRVPSQFVLCYMDRYLKGPFFQIIPAYIREEPYLQHVITHNFMFGHMYLAPLVLDVVPPLGFQHSPTVYREVGDIEMFISERAVGSLAVLLRHHGECIFDSVFVNTFYDTEEIVQARHLYFRQKEIYKYLLLLENPPHLLPDLWNIVIDYAVGAQRLCVLNKQQNKV
jgi:hypothetical protein